MNSVEKLIYSVPLSSFSWLGLSFPFLWIAEAPIPASGPYNNVMLLMPNVMIVAVAEPQLFVLNSLKTHMDDVNARVQ